MKNGSKIQTLVRLTIIVAVCGVISTLIARPPADASDGYGVTTFAMSEQAQADVLAQASLPQDSAADGSLSDGPSTLAKQ